MSEIAYTEMVCARRVAGERDWFICPSWEQVYAQTGLTPAMLPGVRTVTGHPANELVSRERHPSIHNKQAGASAFAPFPYQVHRSHLPVLGLEPLPELIDLDGLEDDLTTLWDHQRSGVEFIQTRRGSLLADEQRCGKTPTIIYAHEPKVGALVVISPVAGRAVWHEWAARRFGACLDVVDGESCSICARVGVAHRVGGHPSFTALEGRKPNLDLLKRGAQVVHLTYAAVGPWSECFAAFGTIGTLVCDEAHLAGVQNRRNPTVLAIKRLNTCADRTVFASGTPMWNMPAGLFPIVDTICPTAFGPWWSYAIRYCDSKPGAHGWSSNGKSNERELERRLSAIMLRRTWSEIRPNLPPIQRSIEYVELTPETHDAIFVEANELRKATGLGKPQTVVGNLERLRKLYAKPKLKRAVELIRSTIASGHSVVAWTYHKDVARSLVEMLSTPGTVVFGPVHGDVTGKQREKILEDCRQEKRPRVLVATMGVLATSISLTWASHQVFVELDWTPAVIAQAEMRPFDGQQSVSSVMLVADCDTDRRQADALLSKLEAMRGLGLQAGTGDATDVLSKVFRIEAGRTLDAVAELIVAGEQL